MANIKITDLPELSETPNDANLLEIVDKASETPTSKKITWANIKAAVLTDLGITEIPVPVTQGGTGAATAQAAINTLTAVSGATNEYVLTKDTVTGNAIFKAAAGGGGGGGDFLVMQVFS